MKLDDSLYIYGDDDVCFDCSAIAPFAYFIKGSHPDTKAAKNFDPYGITYIDEKDGQDLINNLRKFAVLLNRGMTVLESLTNMGFYNSTIDGSCSEEDSMAKLDLQKLKNTAETLAYWTEQTLQTYDTVSVIGN